MLVQKKNVCSNWKIPKLLLNEMYIIKSYITKYLLATIKLFIKQKLAIKFK